MKTISIVFFVVILITTNGRSQNLCRGNIVVWTTDDSRQGWDPTFLNTITIDLELELSNIDKPGIKVLARSQGYKIDQVIQNETNLNWGQGLSEQSKSALRKISADIVLFSNGRQDVQYAKYTLTLNFVNILTSTNEKGTTIEFSDSDFQNRTKRKAIIREKLNDLFDCSSVEILIENTNTELLNKRHGLDSLLELEEKEKYSLTRIREERDDLDSKCLKKQISSKDCIKQIEVLKIRVDKSKNKLLEIDNAKRNINIEINELNEQLEKLRTVSNPEDKPELTTIITPPPANLKPNCTDPVRLQCLNNNELIKICCDDFFNFHKGHYVQVMSTFNTIDECKLKNLFEKNLSPHVFLVKSPNSTLAVYLGPFNNKIDAGSCLQKILHRYAYERPAIRSMITKSLCD